MIVIVYQTLPSFLGKFKPRYPPNFATVKNRKFKTLSMMRILIFNV